MIGAVRLVIRLHMRYFCTSLHYGQRQTVDSGTDVAVQNVLCPGRLGKSGNQGNGMKPKVFCVAGTRPEAIKLAPVILELGRAEFAFDVRTVTTGQHRELLDRVLGYFDIAADHDLKLMKANQGLADFAAQALAGLSRLFAAERPDLVLGQGDTTTTLCAALASYYNRIPFGHIEAGLRSGNPLSPFPEEKHRVLAGHLAQIHFAATTAARDNLLREGIHPSAIHVTGNTGIDALLMTAHREVPLPLTPSTDRYVLVTAHRRENFGKPLEEICAALRLLVARRPGWCVVFPVHPNPNVRELVHARLNGHPRIHCIDPVPYPQFVALMKKSFLILTDSGGIQEEAPALGKRLLVLRSETERTEGVRTGAASLVGSDPEKILAAVENICREREAFVPSANLYGDGRAAQRIARILAARFGMPTTSEAA